MDHRPCRRVGSQRGILSVDIGLLLSCRQIYHEAKYTLYSTTNFSFQSPKALSVFMCRVGHGPAANDIVICNFHLKLASDLERDEYTWNKALSLMVKRLPGYVTINQQ